MADATKPIGKKVRETDIPTSVGQATPEQARKWLGQQVVYTNFAGKIDELDQRVQTFVQHNRERFYQRMGSVMERWETIWDAANGNPFWHEYDDDVHVPETQKKLNWKVARVEEALLDFDPVFEVEGTRGDLPPWKAQIIGAYVYRMMEIGGFRKHIQPSSRDTEICNVGAIKLHWDVRKGTVVDRDWSLRERKDGSTYWHDERRMRDAVTTSIKYRQVDPFLFLYDIDCGDLEGDDCAFVGDESDQFIHELEAMTKNGLFSEKNMTQVKERKAGHTSIQHAAQTSSEWPDLRRQSRSIAQGPDFIRETTGENDPRKVRCIEMWAWFDFGDGFDGISDPLGRRVTGVHKVVITIAQGVVLQFRLNPFDKKFHPYAIGRINQNGHEAVAPSNFEQVIQTNAQFDGYRSNVLRHASLSVAPIGRTSGEWPTGSLLNMKPGTIVSNVGDFQEIKISDLPRDVAYMEQSFRRECEETSGVLNVYESPQGTATETERKVQEQQRMIRNSIRAIGEMMRQLALKTYWICAQFSTGPQRFAVSGKASSILGKSFEITPDLLQEEVDMRFLGLDNMHVFGNRVAGMAQWSQRWAPLLPATPTVNLLGLMRKDYELTVGRDHIQDIFPAEEPVWATWPQDQENEMLLAGLQVPVNQRDDDKEHMRDMDKCMKNLKSYPKYVQTHLLDHYMGHVEQDKKKMAEQKAAMEKSMREQAVMGGRPGVDKAPTPGGMEALTKAQEPGITPGPTQARTVSKPGRSGDGMSQSQAMTA